LTQVNALFSSLGNDAGETEENPMSHVPHELAAEFPQDAARLAQLEREDAHLARISERYHTVNRAIHRAETDVEPCSDEHMTDMRKERMRLKDEVSSILARDRVG
jgi:uncharacterized protein YdcH (DUF465 family)